MMARHVLSRVGAAWLGAAALGVTIVAPAVMAAPCLSRAKGPAAGSFGFDWLQPNSATCSQVQTDTIRTFRSCAHQPDGTFGLKDPAYVCRIGPRSELMIYADKATCERNLDVMQSNGP